MTEPTSNPKQQPLASSQLWELAQSTVSYAIDTWQRSILYADVRRQRGDQYRAHLQEHEPNVLKFPYEKVMSGVELPRPVNYMMLRILPDVDQQIDATKRPFVVIDPRAGHGPGIGGFKPDSEIGAAMKAGHPCYFVGFLPDPVPGQTVEDVMRAQAEFVRRAGELHPDSHGKPAIIGNCQAGWQVLMAASLWPELFGPIIVAGTPLSYWAGDNPMRYAGGLLGGSWVTALTSDMGAGRFDGAWLVQNFESLDPANTWWSKQYKLYSEIDTEADRYLEFEKYWGGYVYLNDVEMQTIVDDLFIGNKLATAELLTSDGLRIDMRNIRSPIIVFCSYGDNITPPAQALGWITDLYRDDTDVISHDQTIVYATHDSIGHLGIFVSGSVGRKEHSEFAANIDIIDLLPAGIYRAEVEDAPDTPCSGNMDNSDYMMLIQRSTMEDIRTIVKPDPGSERRFAAAARISEINLALYRNFLQPWVQTCSTPYSAQWLQALHPLRISYEWWSSSVPYAATIKQAAQQVREQRKPVDTANPWLSLQTSLSDAIVYALDQFRDQRDQTYAQLFDTLYGSPWAQALAGQTVSDTQPARTHPGESPEHRDFIAREQEQLRAHLYKGGLLEAGITAIFHVLNSRGEANVTHYRHAAQLQKDGKFAGGYDMAELRQLVRHQARLLAYDADAAVAAIPSLLADVDAAEIRAFASLIREMLCSGDDCLCSEEETLLDATLALFEAAAQRSETESKANIAKLETIKPAVKPKPTRAVKAKKKPKSN